MKIVVFGATGATGRHVVDHALSAGHTVVAVARRPEQVTPRPNLIARAGDVLDTATLSDSCRDADAVISCIGPRNSLNAGAIVNNLRPGTTMSVDTAHMVAAAESAGVSRFVFQSGIGLSDGSELSRSDRWILRLLWRPIFCAAIRDKTEGERILRASMLDWVIVRPVAACLLRAVSESAWTRQVIDIGQP